MSLTSTGDEFLTIVNEHITQHSQTGNRGSSLARHESEILARAVGRSNKRYDHVLFPTLVRPT